MRHLTFDPYKMHTTLKRLYFHVIVSSLLFFSALSVTRAADFSVQYRVSRPHCILYLLEALRGDPHHSSHLKDLFIARRGESIEDARLINKYRELFKGDWENMRLPADGGFKRDLAYALEVIAVNSATVEEFLRHSRLLFTAEKHNMLCEIMHHFEPLYQELFWKECESDITEQCEELKKKAAEIGFEERLSQMAHLSGSTWPEKESFVVALVPVPKKPGEHIVTFGHANGFIEVVEVPKGAKIGQHLGVVAHEIFHTFWSCRPLPTCKELKGWFTVEGAQSPYKELNEALATAVGNGWIESLVAGKKPSGQWYSDPYIDGYGKGIFELVKGYSLASRQIDRDFARKAIAIFRKEFPGADDDPSLFMRELFIVTNDNESMSEEFRLHLSRCFSVHSIYGGVPIDDNKTRTRFSDYSEITTLFMMRPEELKLLEGYGLEPSMIKELVESAACRKSLLVRKRMPSRWLIFCVAPSHEEREKALQSLCEKKSKQPADK